MDNFDLRRIDDDHNDASPSKKQRHEDNAKIVFLILFSDLMLK